jgi:uncharacterized protein with HEPN domain
MKDDILAPLDDILQAGQAIRNFVSGRQFQDYSSDDLLRSAVERKFEVIGEALNRIKRDDPEVLPFIRNARDVVSFRNILIHGYDAIDDKIVWGIIQEELDQLLADVGSLLKEKN